MIALTILFNGKGIDIFANKVVIFTSSYKSVGSFLPDCQGRVVFFARIIYTLLASKLLYGYFITIVFLFLIVAFCKEFTDVSKDKHTLKIQILMPLSSYTKAEYMLGKYANFSKTENCQNLNKMGF